MGAGAGQEPRVGLWIDGCEHDGEENLGRSGG